MWNRNKTTFSSHYCFRNRETSDTGVFGYIDVNNPKERSPEVWQIRHVTHCIYCYKSITYSSQLARFLNKL